MKTVKIEDTKYIRDIDSKAVLSTNRNALEQYKLERQNYLYLKYMVPLVLVIIIQLQI